ncbi:Hypothetical protein PENO1_005500 [Penicillium occitanis (nom. inval.)]|nr:hypothetical protein PENOC_014270 [Penicillium occitanis (nom. inval.)]PCH08680.1 Hypothetical protein PENO1_005500 [Penicillium occitanis (nom. inval.)]
MSRFIAAQHSGLQSIINYPNMRGLFAPPPPITTKRKQPGHQRSESFEFRAELKKWVQELNQNQSNGKPGDENKGPKRARASPEPEEESIAASPPKKQKTEAEGDDGTTPEEDAYSIWDAMLWGPSFPGITGSLSSSSPQKGEQALSNTGSISGAAPTVSKLTIRKSRKFKIFEDEDAWMDDYSMAGREVPWVPEYDDEKKENEPPEFEMDGEEANVVSESQEYHYPSWSRRLPREILGELQHN